MKRPAQDTLLFKAAQPPAKVLAVSRPAGALASSSVNFAPKHPAAVYQSKAGQASPPTKGVTVKSWQPPAKQGGDGIPWKAGPQSSMRLAGALASASGKPAPKQPEGVYQSKGGSKSGAPGLSQLSKVAMMKGSWQPAPKQVEGAGIPWKSGPPGLQQPPPPPRQAMDAESWRGAPAGPAPGRQLAPKLPAAQPPQDPELARQAELLRQGEEMLRKGLELQSQLEEARMRQEQELRQQEQEEQRREEERLRKEEEDRMLQEAEELQAEMSKLLDAAEEQTTKATEKAASFAVLTDTSDEELLRDLEEFELDLGVTANAVRMCTDVMSGKHLQLRGPTEATRQRAAEILRRSQRVKAAADLAASKIKAKKVQAQVSVRAQALQAELAGLLADAEARVSKARESAAFVDSLKGRADDEIIKCANEFSQAQTEALDSIKACLDLMQKNIVALKGNKEALQRESGELIKRVYKAKRDIDTMVEKVRPKRAEAQKRLDEEAKREVLRKAAEKQEQLFKRYDVDGDGLLNAREIQEFVTGEYKFDLPEEKLQGILQGAAGVPMRDFGRLKSQIGIAWSEWLARQRRLEKEERERRAAEQGRMVQRRSAETTSAIPGVETEVAKSEEKARALAAAMSGRFVRLEVVAERCGEVEISVEAAKDFLTAAREQAERLGGDQHDGLEPEAKLTAATEERKIVVRLKALDVRLGKVNAALTMARNRVALQEKKAALLREVEEAAERAA